MIKINLANKEKSEIEFEISKFPDGQQSVTIKSPFFNTSKSVEVISRMNSFKDLELIICANVALKEIGVKEIHLFVPYFLGARSDRKFVDGGSNYLKDVICPIINMQDFKSVTVLDPHSDVLEACIKNFKKVTNIEFVRKALTQIDNTNSAREKMVIVSPDAGAMKKIYSVAEEFSLDRIIIAAKHRDLKSGKITHTEVPDLNKYSPDSNFVIIDDICDGGRTFTEISKVIKSHVWPRDEYFSGKIYLIITHGIFSAGLLDLSRNFNKVFTTNSVRNLEVEEFSDYTVEKNFVIQFDVV